MEQKTKLFMDTEFTGLHKYTTLVSLGIVAETGETFYAEFTDYNKSQVTDDQWLQENIIDKLLYNDLDNAGAVVDSDPNNFRVKACKQSITECLVNWLVQFAAVEIWLDCYAYDWVLFCDLFGHAFNIPKNVNYIPRDLCTFLETMGIDPDINRLQLLKDHLPEFAPGQLDRHNALNDAYIIKGCYQVAKDY